MGSWRDAINLITGRPEDTDFGRYVGENADRLNKLEKAGATVYALGSYLNPVGLVANTGRWLTDRPDAPATKAPVRLPSPSPQASSGGGGRGGLPPIKAPTAPAYGGSAPTSSYYQPMSADLRNQIAALSGGGPGAQAKLEADYARKAAEIKNRYNLAVTPEEKAQLRYELEVLGAQARAGTAAIDRYYGKAHTAATDAGRQVRREAGDWAAQMQGVYNRGAGDIRTGTVKATNQDGAADTAGTGLIALSVPGPNAAQALTNTGKAKGASAIIDSKLASDDMKWLAATGKQEAGAQVAGVRNTLATATADATADHRRAWQERINRDWEAMNAALDGLEGRYTDRSWSMTDARNSALAGLLSNDYTAQQDAARSLWEAQNAHAQARAEWDGAFAVQKYLDDTEAYKAKVAARGAGGGGGGAGIPVHKLGTTPGEYKDGEQLMLDDRTVARDLLRIRDLANAAKTPQERRAILATELGTLPAGSEQVARKLGLWGDLYKLQ